MAVALVDPPVDRSGRVPRGGQKSATDRTLELRILGGDDVLYLPAKVCTKVVEVKEQLADRLAVDADRLEFFYKQGPYMKKVSNFTQMMPITLVKGIRSFRRERKQYSHPHVVVGAGHGGLRMSLRFLLSGQENFVCFERRGQVGGTSWLEWANPQSRIQTELGTYHLGYDAELPPPTATEPLQPWISRDELLRHFNKVIEETGVLGHIVLGVDVVAMRVVPDKVDSSQSYAFTLKRNGKTEAFVGASFMYFPGNLTNPRRLNFAGEETFTGTVNYGMFSEMAYEQVTGKAVAICGFGAFAVENIRSCCEYKARKIYLICRRKNLCMPRVVSWEINNTVVPMSAALMMRHMQRMYDLIGDDPWSYYAVSANASRSHVAILQSSRFGIGDVYFLSRYFGACELVMGSVDRLDQDAIHIDSGRTLSGVSALLKCFGFVGEWAVDRLFGLRKMTGFWVNGDYRRGHWSEMPTINATRFGGTSYSPGIAQATEWFMHMLDYPRDWEKMIRSVSLPENYPNPETDTPGYVIDAKTGTAMTITILTALPILQQNIDSFGAFKRRRNVATHSLEQIIAAASDEWHKYCEMFKSYGYERPVPDYPYAAASLHAMVEEADKEAEDFTALQHQRAMLMTDLSKA